MSQINVNNLTFAYEGTYDNIFENVNFQIDTDWKLGFTGRNGRGKTTFLNLLLGKYDYQGAISTSVDFEYFPFFVEDENELTGNIFESIAPLAESWELIRELNLLKVDSDVIYRPFCTLSKGEQTKVLLAAMFLKENNFLLIDEPTNHLDMFARETVANYLNRKKGFILVSHDRAFLDACTDHTLSINRTDITVQKGNFSTWIKNKEMEDSFEFAQNSKLKKEIGRLSSSIKQTTGWSGDAEKSKFHTTNSGVSVDRGYIGAKSAKMMKKAKCLQKRVERNVTEKESLLKNVETADKLKLHPLSYRTKNIITLSNISISYDNREILSEVNLNIQNGDRVALWGKNGCGKSSIIKLILGNDIPHTGEVYKNSDVIISYLPQEFDGINGNLTDFAVNRGIDESLLLTILRKLGFERVQFEKDISEYSAGQKKKVLIAASLCTHAHLYIWDEPLNYIDVISRMQIENLIKEFSPTLLFVEHDKAFCQDIATKILKL